ncbi:MAG: 4-hydroxythreonine-4-phosphate dehydrogenase PdxA [Desulfuromonadales bacterium]|nr:4-hydroxythreonine-4-phosphate dehydrogenase PdxA [Desulfuromonadales bacterium]
MSKPIIITMGDPTGVGPEIIIKALLDGAFDPLSRPLLVAGDVGVLQRAARIFDHRAETQTVEKGGITTLQIGERQLAVQPLSSLPTEQLVYGNPDIACGGAMARYIDWAAEQSLAGEAAAMVTAPINKAAIRAAGIKFPGHTELLADRCGVKRVVMMLAGERLKVCLVTTHIPLDLVSQQLNRESILDTIRITASALRRDFGFKQPRLAVLALNPHAGENGLFGDEESLLIAPAIAAARTEGIDASGPHSADALFHFAVQGAYDAVICMYHDQGLIPLKLLHFDDGVNVTLGLPIIRTSVDHGTAYDIAGTGSASYSSLIAALKMAGKMANLKRDEPDRLLDRREIS